jgi:TorA maturation chaperone TorD
MAYQCTSIAETNDADGADLKLARLHVYRFLSLVLSDPESGRYQRLTDCRIKHAALAGAEYIRDEPAAYPASYARGELPPSALNIPRLVSMLNNDPQGCAAQHRSIFGLLISKACPPYETEYSRQTFAVSRSHALADVAAFYRAFGLRPSPDLPERCDHVSLELELMAWLIAKELHALDDDDDEHAATCRGAQVRFARDHLAWWLPAFARALRRRADGIAVEEELGEAPITFFGAVAIALAAFTAAERALLGIVPGQELAQPDAAEHQDGTSAREAALGGGSVVAHEPRS